MNRSISSGVFFIGRRSVAWSSSKVGGDRRNTELVDVVVTVRKLNAAINGLVLCMSVLDAYRFSSGRI